MPEEKIVPSGKFFKLVFMVPGYIFATRVIYHFPLLSSLIAFMTSAKLYISIAGSKKQLYFNVCN